MQNKVVCNFWNANVIDSTHYSVEYNISRSYSPIM